MILARVVGTIVASAKHAAYDGMTILYVQQLDEQRQDVGDGFIAVDRAQAGVGDTVLIMKEGNGARQMFGKKKLPINSVIIGIVDEVSLA